MNFFKKFKEKRKINKLIQISKENKNSIGLYGNNKTVNLVEDGNIIATLQKNDINSLYYYDSKNNTEYYLYDNFNNIFNVIEQNTLKLLDNLKTDIIKKEDILTENVYVKELMYGVDVQKAQITNEETMESMENIDIEIGTYIFKYSIIGVNSQKEYRKGYFILDRFFDIGKQVTKDLLSQIILLNFKGKQISFEEYHKFFNISRNTELICSECEEKFNDSHEYYNHLYKTGHKDFRLLIFPYDENFSEIIKKFNLKFTDSEKENAKEIIEISKKVCSEEMKESINIEFDQ